MSENKDNKLTLINEKTANDYLTHTGEAVDLTILYHSCTIESDSKMNCYRKLHKIDNKGSL